jgi:hypothetical protein
MKYLTVKIFLFLIFVSVAYSYAQVNYFSATSDAGNVKLAWTTADESNINHFSIQRKTPQQSSFIEIGIVQQNAGNNHNYTYEDQSLYKLNDVVFTYRIVSVNKDNSTSVYPHDISVSPNISGIKRTWGSIKAMFR